jgi:imidazolonepropionase-like amidohydrolase
MSGLARPIYVLLAVVLMLGLEGASQAAPARSSSASGPLPFDTPGQRSVALVGATIEIGDGTTLEGGVVEIRGTRIVRVVGPEAADSLASDVERIDVSGKVLTPGLIAAGTPLGLTEIGAERSSRDDARGGDDLVRAAYDAAPAINASSVLLAVQAVDGITTAAVTPSGGLFSGQVAWIDLVTDDHRSIVARPRVAVVAHLGQAYADSRAATLAKMREILDDTRFYQTRAGAFDRRQTRDLVAHRLDVKALQPVVSGQVPLAVSADRASDILALIDLAKEYQMKVVLVGGAQAWQVADALAEARIPVIVQPSRNLPGGFDSLGARLDNAAALHAAGVEVGIAVLGDAHNVRNVTQEAGIAVANGLDRAAAMRAVTLTIARAYGMEASYGSLAEGKVANVVVWDADPFELSSVPSRVFIRGRSIPLTSRQSLLRDRYLQRAPKAPAGSSGKSKT